MCQSCAGLTSEIGTFSAIALLLAALGVYGLISYFASQRTHEIGIRMALGTHPRDVVALMIREAMTLISLGIVIGLPAALALTRLMRRMLFGIKPDDPITFAGVAALLAVVAFVACYLPARRASRMDPLAALRHE